MSNKYFDEAREKVDLQNYIESSPGFGPGKKVGGSLRWRRCPACEEGGVYSHRLSMQKGGDMWYCFACAKFGSVTDFAGHLKRVNSIDDLIEVAKKLLNKESIGELRTYDKAAGVKAKAQIDVAAANTQIAIKMLSEQITGRFVNKSAFRYLANDRFLGKSVVSQALDRKILAFLPENPYEANAAIMDICGEEVLRKAGILKDGKKVTGWAFRPILLFAHDRMGCEFRMVGDPKEGDQKALRYGPASAPWYWKGSDRSCVIAEGAIDMLSQVCLNPDATVLGLPSCNNYKENWFSHLVNEGLADDFIIRLDNDKVKKPNAKNFPGNEWSGTIQTQLSALGLSSVIDLPDAGDINEQLKLLRTQKASF